MEGGITAIVLMVLIFGTPLFIKFKRSREAKKFGAKLYTAAIHLHGVPGLEQKQVVKLFFADDKLIMKSKRKTIDLSYEKLTAIKSVKQTDLLQMDKSVIGRGVVGGLLLGPIGAIIGGMSAVGGKKNARGELLIINYLPTGTDEPQVMIFDLQKLSRPKRFEQFVQRQRPELVEPSYVTL